MEIRGYGPVKDVAIAKVKAEVASRLTRLARPAETDRPVPLRNTG